MSVWITIKKVNLGLDLDQYPAVCLWHQESKKDRREEGIDRERLVKESRKELAPQS